MSLQGTTPIGTLSVELESTSSFLMGALPVEVRDSRSRLIRTFKGGQLIELEVGLYSVSAILDDGRRSTRVVHVEPDARAVVRFAPPSPALAAYAKLRAAAFARRASWAELPLIDGLLAVGAQALVATEDWKKVMAGLAARLLPRLLLPRGGPDPAVRLAAAIDALAAERADNGDLDQAIRLHEVARRAFDDAHADTEAALTRAEMAALLSTSDDGRIRALSLNKEALALLDGVDAPERALVLRERSRLLEETKRPQEALQLYVAALYAFMRLGDRRQWLDTLNDFARLAERVGDPRSRVTEFLNQKARAFENEPLSRDGDPRLLETSRELRTLHVERGCWLAWMDRFEVDPARNRQPCEEVPWMRLRTASTTILVGVPANPYDDYPHNSCMVFVEGDRVRVLPAPERRVASAVHGLIESGNVVHAVDLLESATELLASKYQDPAGAALGGLLLQRLGRLEPHAGWVENLARDFPWLADARILLAAVLRNTSERDRGLDVLLSAARQPLLFADALSLALALLRRWPDRARFAERQAAQAALADAAVDVDFSGVVLTQRNAKPAPRNGSPSAVPASAVPAPVLVRRA
jgi:hypothetical protein